MKVVLYEDIAPAALTISTSASHLTCITLQLLTRKRSDMTRISVCLFALFERKSSFFPVNFVDSPMSTLLPTRFWLPH